jgi:DNA-binding PadR family transcriptional regulator
VILLLLVVATLGVLIGVFASLLSQVQKNIKTASWLVLRLLADYECKMTGEEISDIILKKSMGLISLTPDQLIAIIRTQCDTGFVHIANAADTWKDTEFELTPKGQQHLSQIMSMLNGE